MKEIRKITKYGGQTRVAIPKKIAKETGIDGARVVEIWSTEGRIIHIMEYNGKESGKNRISGR